MENVKRLLMFIDVDGVFSTGKAIKKANKLLGNE